MDLQQGDKPAAHHDENLDHEYEKEAIATVTLFEAFNEQKPSLLSRNMLKLYFIMGESLQSSAAIRTSNLLRRNWVFGFQQ